MAQIIPSGGMNESEPTLIGDNQMQSGTGAEYRVGQRGLYVARGRQKVGTVNTTGTALYEAGFDGSAGYLIAHAGNTYQAASIAATLSFSAFDSQPAGSSAVVGCHYSNRHYLANGVQNRRIELLASGITAFPIGMSASTFGIGVSVTQGAGNMTATTGLVYWATEYDSVRGIESVTGASVSTGPFTNLNSVIAFVTGISANPRSDTIRWYRSVDGGGYPDGGLIASTAIGTTSTTDTLTDTANLNVPNYGLVSIGGLDIERDAAPPVFSMIFGPFQDSLLAVSVAEPRNLRFTPAGYPDSWPAGYAVPINTPRQDVIVTGVVLPGRIGVFCNDSVQVIYRLPRDSDSIFAAGEAQDTLTDARGCVSRRGACLFTPPGASAHVAWVARDGIWISTLASSPVPVTDLIDWNGRISIANLNHCRLTDDPQNRRLVFVHRRATDTTYNTGLWYIDYQDFTTPFQYAQGGGTGLRITFADHGPLTDAQTIAASDGVRRLASLDSRSGNGQVYIEANQDADDSHLVDSSGSIHFQIRTKEFLPAGARATVNLEQASWMHDAGPATITHRFYFDRQDSFPEVKDLPKPATRHASSVVLGKNVNSVSLELESTGTTSYGVHWIDIQGMEIGPLGGRGGA